MAILAFDPKATSASHFECGNLMPTFRSSCSIAAPTVHELRKVMGTSKPVIPVPLFYLKFLNQICRLWCRNFK
jgi:hypothetical protein